ncbi:MAG: ABC transporter ATP-binding protein [Candidatus Omnitrophica bacterium]|nr:ABC transporter ATP-binding protein [Candidatus Omnitrophota bacterium]
MADIIINAKKLTKTYRLFAEDVHAVNGIDFSIEQGEFVSIMGASGSGKTTLLDMIGCLDRISSGRLEVLGRDVTTLRETELVKVRRGNIGFIFQDFSLISSLTALENVELALYFARSLPKKNNAQKMLEKVGLGKRIRHLPRQLSGGEQQRVAIARALATEPRLLLADEPTGHLDSDRSQEIFDVFNTLNREDGLTIVVTTHNQKLGLQAGRAIFLQDGCIVSKERSNLFN